MAKIHIQVYVQKVCFSDLLIPIIMLNGSYSHITVE